MPVIDLQRSLQEAGRIRIGQQVPTAKGKRPARLETFRLTSPDRTKIENAARLYGGRVEAWEAPAGSQWEVITETSKLPVIVPPAAMSFSQYLELWSGGGCLRRCTGAQELLTEQPCICATEGTQGSDRQCDYHSRLSVLLRDMTGLGLWRLDTQGYFAAIELAGAVDIISQAAGHGRMLPAVLRLEQRVIRRPGEPTRRFPVPVLDVQVTAGELLGPPPNGQRELTQPRTGYIPGDDEDPIADAIAPSRANVTPIPADSPQHWPGGSIAQQAGVTERPPDEAPPPKKKASRRRAEPIPATGVQPRTREQAEAERHTEPPPPPADDEPPWPPVQHDEPERLPRGGRPLTPDELDHGYKGPEHDGPTEETVTVTAHLADAENSLISREQLTKLHVCLKECGLGDRTAGLDWLGQAIGREITSSKQLTRREAVIAINLLEEDLKH